MKKISLFFLAVFLMSASGNRGAFDKIFDEYYKEAKGRGNGMCVILLKGNDTLYSRSQGKIGPNTVIPVASASKWLSATVIMALVDEGKLSLDDSLGKFIKDISPDKRGLTFRRCFSHTSGLAGKNFAAKGVSNRNVSMAECAKAIDKIYHPQHQPGEVFEYGAISMQLAARAAEIASGMDFSALLKKYVTDPLDMPNTAFSTPSSDHSNPLVPGGIKSCANDYLHFLTMLRDKGMYKGKRVLSENSVNEMLKNQVPANAKAVKSPFDMANNSTLKNEGARYGIGNWCEIFDANGNPKLSSSPGLFGFTPWYDEQHNVIGVISVLSYYQKAGNIFVAMREEAGK